MRPSPLQNRVDPFGAIHAVAARGLFTGNRGVIHDPATRTLLGRAGRACFVFPSRSLEVLLGALSAKDLHAKRIAFVHPRRDEPANRVLVECAVGRAGGLVVDAPWVLYDLADNERGFDESALLRALSRRASEASSRDEAAPSPP